MTYGKIIAASLATLLALTLGACSSSPNIRSTYDYNREVDFSSYRTYAFISEHPMAVSEAQGAVNPLLENRLKEAIRIAMNTKGYSEVSDPETASMAIGFTVGSRDKIKVDTYPSTFHTGYARRGYYLGYDYGTETRVRQYTEGQLAVDVYDVASHHPAYHGVASTRISDSDRANPQATLNAVAAEALAGFPVAGGTITPAK